MLGSLNVINQYNLAVTALLVFWWWNCIMDTFICTSNIKNDETISLNRRGIIIYVILLVVFFIGMFIYFF